jgi:apolipoprotein N-acyltransferase
MVVSPLLLSLSFPRISLGVLAWLGLSPFLFELRRRSLSEAVILGFLFGCFFVIGSFSWALRLSQISLFGFLIGLIVFSLYFLIFGLFYRLISQNIGIWIIIGAPVLWVALEYLRSNLFFLSWPWNLIGHSQYRYLPIIQISDITGVYGISFLIVMVNETLSQIPDFFIKKRAANSNNTSGGSNLLISILIAMAAIIFTLAYGFYRIITPITNPHLRVTLVQPNLITRDFMSPADQVKQLQEYDRLTREGAKAKPDLIVWPASSLPAPIGSSRLVQETLKQLAQETGAYLLVGGAGLEKFGPLPLKEEFSPFSNSEFLISPSGTVEEEYNKIRLVPFNEYLPLQGRIKWPDWITTLRKSFIPGEEYTLFQISGIKFGSPICWESLFPDLFRRFVMDGAQFMVSVTNEGFLGHTSGPYQSLAINIFRAVENRIAIARSAPTGVTAFINPDGKIVERVRDNKGKDLFVSGFLVRDIPLTNQKTLYTIYGDIFAYVVIGISALMILVSILPRRFFYSRLSN